MATKALTITYQPWWEEVCRLYGQGCGASEIGEKLNKPTYLICQIMERPEFKHSMAVQQRDLKLLFMERLVNLWDLSETMVEVAKRTAEAYLEKLSEATPEKELKDLRKDALTVMSDILNRIGLKAPDKVDIRSHTITEDVTPLATYERRLELIRSYKEQGMNIPDGLAKVDLDG